MKFRVPLASFVSLTARGTERGMDSRGYARTANTPGARCPQLECTCQHPKGSRGYAHTGDTPGALAPQLRRTCRRPRGSRVARARIADTPGARRSQLNSKRPPFPPGTTVQSPSSRASMPPPRARRARARARRVWAVEVLEGRPAEETRRTDRVRGGHHRGEGGSPRSIRGGCGSFRRRRGASSSGARRSDKVARASRRRFSRTRQEGTLTKERYETPHRDEEKHTDT